MPNLYNYHKPKYIKNQFVLVSTLIRSSSNPTQLVASTAAHPLTNFVVHTKAMKFGCCFSWGKNLWLNMNYICGDFLYCLYQRPFNDSSGFPLYRMAIACSPSFCISAEELCRVKKTSAACIKCLSD